MVDPPSTGAPEAMTRILDAARGGEREVSAELLPLERDWHFAKAWLNARLSDEDGE
jgi:hypothetical protein